MQKRTVRGATVRHDGDLVSFACHCAPLAAQPPATRTRGGPQSDTLVDALERGRRVAACRGKCLAAAAILSGPEACRSPDFEVPWLVFPASSSCRGLAALSEWSGASRQVPWCALIGLPGKLLLPGSCLLSLYTLFLDGCKGTLEGLGVRPASLAAGCCNCPCTSSGY